MPEPITEGVATMSDTRPAHTSGPEGGDAHNGPKLVVNEIFGPT